MLIYRAPAKVNLFLEVLGKRSDNYHNLNTFFLKIDLWDKLYFRLQEKGIKICCDHRHVPQNSNNLVYKAARLLQQQARVQKGVQIKIEKKIPVAAGLGGGSSDAAITLVAVNKLWNLKLKRHTLLKLARQLGSDVPIFLSPFTSAWARGRGDRLRPLKLKKKYWLVLVNPQIAVSTKQIFKGVPRYLTNIRNDVKLLTNALNRADIETIGTQLFNRLEDITFRKYRGLAKIKKNMSALGVRAVLMSGSGSVIFGIVKNREEAMCIRNKLQRKSLEVMVVRSL